MGRGQSTTTAKVSAAARGGSRGRACGCRLGHPGKMLGEKVDGLVICRPSDCPAHSVAINAGTICGRCGGEVSDPRPSAIFEGVCGRCAGLAEQQGRDELRWEALGAAA